jgi:hypothetical protein
LHNAYHGCQTSKHYDKALAACRKKMGLKPFKLFIRINTQLLYKEFLYMRHCRTILIERNHAARPNTAVMNKYYFSYTGCVVIDAESTEEANDKFDDLTAQALADNIEDHTVTEFQI